MEMTYGGALVMPSSYAMMDEEEMMYLEGGKFYGVNLTAAQCGVVAETLSFLGLSFTLTGFAVTLIALIPGLQAAFAAVGVLGKLATACTISWLVFDYCSRNNGMRLGYESSTNKFVYSTK